MVNFYAITAVIISSIFAAAQSTTIQYFENQGLKWVQIYVLSQTTTLLYCIVGWVSCMSYLYYCSAHSQLLQSTYRNDTVNISSNSNKFLLI